MSACLVPVLLSSSTRTMSNQSVMPSGKKKLIRKSFIISDVLLSMVQRYEKFCNLVSYVHHFLDSSPQFATELFICAKIKNGKSVRAEAQVRKWNREEKAVVYESFITHYEPEGIGARAKILEYEKNRSIELRKKGELDPNKHKRP